MIKDGGPAFPHQREQWSEHECHPSGVGGNLVRFEHPHHDGMSLRDWFAGMALQGAVAREGIITIAGDRPGKTADEAYTIADAMLAARERGDG